MITKLCLKCKTMKFVDDFYIDIKRKDGYRCWCKACERLQNKIREPRYNETRKKWREDNREQYRNNKKVYYINNKEKILNDNKQWRQTLHGKFLSYKKGAKQRGIDFLLSEEEFEKFWKIPCNYCGSSIETIGIDRINSLEPYTLKNVVPCCHTCNIMKGSIDYKSFIEHILKIIKFRGDINENN